MRNVPESCFALALLIGLLGCSGGAAEPETPVDDQRIVYTVNHPLACFAQRIGDVAIEVRCPVPADVDPAFWSPDEDTIVAYQQADLILLNGTGYAKWIDRVSLPMATCVDTSAAFEDSLLVTDDTATHQHGPEGEHTHGELAFTTWLDPTLAIEQARSIANAFTRTWPGEAAAFESNFELLRAELESIDADLARIFSGHEALPLIASHPVYQYLTRRYGLNVVSVHWEPDAAPTEAMWGELATLLVEHPAALMLWEDDPLGDTRRRLGELGIECVVFSPCANTPSEGDYLDVLRANVESLRGAMPPFPAPESNPP